MEGKFNENLNGLCARWRSARFLIHRYDDKEVSDRKYQINSMYKRLDDAPGIFMLINVI